MAETTDLKIKKADMSNMSEEKKNLIYPSSMLNQSHSAENLTNHDKMNQPKASGPFSSRNENEDKMKTATADKMRDEVLSHNTSSKVTIGVPSQSAPKSSKYLTL